MQYSEETVTRSKMIGDAEHSKYPRFLDSDGDGTGTKDMSAAADEYMLIPPDGSLYVVDEIRIVISGVAVMASGGFGTIAALTTGCQLRIMRSEETTDVVERDLTDGVLITTNTELAALGHVEIHNEATGSILQCTIKGPHSINGSNGEYLSFNVQDNLSTLQSMTVSAIMTECFTSS